MPHVNDYSGDSYGKKPRATRLEKTNVNSFRCRECNKLRYVTPRELTRAARPRCLGCGGTLVENEVSVKRTAGGKLERKTRAKQNAAALSDIRTSRKCWACGFHTASDRALAGHLVAQSDCRSEYKRDAKITAGKYLRGSAFWESGTNIKGRRYPVYMVSIGGDYVEIERHRLQGEAKQCVDELNASMSESPDTESVPPGRS